MIREIGEDDLGRWDGDSDPLCDDCQQPLPKEDAVELDGEPAHRSCAYDVEASRSRRAAMDPTTRGLLTLAVAIVLLAIIAMVANGWSL